MAAEGEVLIGDGRCRIRLTPAGPANELGYPAVVEAEAGAFRGSVQHDGFNIGVFREELARLGEQLRAGAELRSYDGFLLRLVGDGKGGITGQAKVVAEHMPPIMLTFEFSIDQSYLPEIIRQLDAEFPPPYYTES